MPLEIVRNDCEMLFPFKAVAKQAIAKFEEQFCYAAEHYFAPQNKE